jgi:O-antigen/teichoic acid export membrane protein
VTQRVPRDADPPRPADDGYVSRLAREGAANFAGVVASASFGFLLVVIIARGFTEAEVGLFFETVALFTLAMSVAVWGADTGLVRTLPRFRVLGRDGDIKSVAAVAIVPVLCVASAIAVAIFLLAPQLSALLSSDVGGDTIEPLVKAVAGFLPIAAVYMVLLALTRGLGHMGPTNLIDRIGRAGSQSLVALLVAMSGLGVVALAVGWALPYAGSCVVASLSAARLLGRAPNLDPLLEISAPPRVVFGEFWRFALPRGLAGVFAVAVLWLDTLLIGALRSTQEAGVYAAGTRYLVFGGFASQAVILAIAPTMSELLTRRDLDTAVLVYRAGTAWGMLIGWPVYLMLAIFAPAVLSIFGPGYVEAQNALTILALAMLVASGVGPVDIVLLMAGKSTWNLLNTFMAVLVNVTLNLLLIPRLGITGAAIAWSVSILTNNLAPLTQVRALIGLHPLGRETAWAGLASLLAFGLLALSIRTVFGPGLRSMVAAGILGLALYSVLLWHARKPLRLPLLAALRARE